MVGRRDLENVRREWRAEKFGGLTEIMVGGEIWRMVGDNGGAERYGGLTDIMEGRRYLEDRRR